MPDKDHISAEGHRSRGKAVRERPELRAEYDFSHGERGRFYCPDAVLSMPVYLEPDVNDFVTKLAERKKVDLQVVVNDLLRAGMELLRSME